MVFLLNMIPPFWESCDDKQRWPLKLREEVSVFLLQGRVKSTWPNIVVLWVLCDHCWWIAKLRLVFHLAKVIQHSVDLSEKTTAACF